MMPSVHFAWKLLKMGGKIKIDSLFLCLLAISVIILPLKWLIAWLLAAIFHEFCHYFALKCFGIEILDIQLGAFGARIESEPMKMKTNLICTMAGPVGSFLLFILIRWFPEVAICGVVQGIYNFLPLYSVDGGFIVENVCKRLLPWKWAGRILCFIRLVIYVILLFAGVYFLISTLRVVPLMLALMIIVKDRKKTLQKVREEVTIVLPD